MAAGKMILYKPTRPTRRARRANVRVPRKPSMRKVAYSAARTLISKLAETKELTLTSGTNVNLPHNNIIVVQSSLSTPLNPFVHSQGTGDPQSSNSGNIIGDSINVKGLLIRAFMENAIDRSKVHYRVMLIRAAKGDTIDRTTLFKSNCNNKIIDQLNTERFKIIASKKFTISQENPGAASVSVAGVPQSGTLGGQATKAIQLWIPGKKFGKYGKVSFENGTNQVKYYDYRLVILAYDWFGTPQDANNVGKINELYTKLYFKDM